MKVPGLTVLSRRATPWLAVLAVLRAGHAHWTEHLSERDRKRLFELISDSRGLPRNLKPSERRDLKALIAQLDLVGLTKTAALAATVGTSRKRSRT